MNCTPTQFNLSYFHYEPKVKGKSKEDRIKAFKQRLSVKVNKVDPNYIKYPKWLRIEFFKYWTSLDNDFGHKMKFEKCKSWNTLLRLETWRKNSEKDPRWQKSETYKQPKKSNIDYGHQDYQAAKERMSQDQPINEIIGSGSRLKSRWDS